MRKEILRVENLNASFEGERALSNFRINLYEGEAVGVIGLNGSGKTTMVKVLSGVCQKDRGTIYLDDQPIHCQNRKEANKAGIYVVQKENKLISNLTVAENIFVVKSLTIYNAVINEKEMNIKINQLLKDFNIDVAPDTIAKELTKGQQVFIEILKVYHAKARIVILDDVMEVFSYKEKFMLIKIIRKLKEKRVSFLITDYKYQNDLDLYDRIAVIREGKTVKILNPDEFDKGLVTNLTVGYEFNESFERNSNVIGETVLELKDIAVGNTLKNINFKVRQGEIVGLFDMEGQSAVEIAGLLSGVTKKYNGAVYLNHSRISLDSVQNAVNSGIGIVSERFFGYQLFRNMTASENAFFPLLKKSSGPFGYVSQKLQKFMVKECEAQLGFSDEAENKEVAYLPKDVECKLLINKWIMKQSKVIMIDNLTLGADILTKKVIYSMLDRACREGIGILFITSDIAEMINLCNRVIVIKNGEIQGDFIVNDKIIDLIYKTIL